MYTELFKSTQDGRPVVKALSLVFPNDLNAYDIENQFLWGDSILIVPVVDQGATTVNAYLPAGIWYDYVKQTIVSNSVSNGRYLKMQIPLDRIGVLIRGGSILLNQEPKLTTKDTRKSKFDLVIALDKDKQANGDLYWDDGIDFKIEKSKNYNFINFHVYKVRDSNQWFTYQFVNLIFLFILRMFFSIKLFKPDMISNLWLKVLQF